MTLQISLLPHDSKYRQSLYINICSLRCKVQSCHTLHLERPLNVQELPLQVMVMRVCVRVSVYVHTHSAPEGYTHSEGESGYEGIDHSSLED